MHASDPIDCCKRSLTSPKNLSASRETQAAGVALTTSQRTPEKQAPESPLVYIFADESCLGNQFEDRSNPGAAAGLIESFDHEQGWYRRDFAHFNPDTTNNRMAIVSGIVGLRQLHHPCRVVFTSDSQYLIKGMKEWIHGWARRGWRRKGGAVENLDLWQDLIREAIRYQIDWRWTLGHADNPKNEYADWLAVSTARARRSSDVLVASRFDTWLAEQQEHERFLDFLDLPSVRAFHADKPPPEI